MVNVVENVLNNQFDLIFFISFLVLLIIIKELEQTFLLH
jgi:hypothetical protein